MRTIFVTGGSGFVGGALLAAFAERGEQVTALARSESAAHVIAARGARPVRGSVNDLDALTARMRGGWAAYEALHVENVIGSRNVLQAARSAGVPRLVLLSTEQVVLGDRP